MSSDQPRFARRIRQRSYDPIHCTDPEPVPKTENLDGYRIRSDLHSTHNAADYIIITHNHFIQDVQPLADYRAQQGLRTKVVDVQDIYDEFNDGILNPNAIREFLDYAYHNWQPPCSDVCLSS